MAYPRELDQSQVVPAHQENCFKTLQKNDSRKITLHETEGHPAAPLFSSRQKSPSATRYEHYSEIVFKARQEKD
jgi:hypothetical protein